MQGSGWAALSWEPLSQPPDRRAGLRPPGQRRPGRTAAARARHVGARVLPAVQEREEGLGRRVLEHRQLARRRRPLRAGAVDQARSDADPRARTSATTRYEQASPAAVRIACAQQRLSCRRARREREEREWPGVRVYLPILCMIVLVVLFASLSFVASKLLGPKRPTSAKQAPVRVRHRARVRAGRALPGEVLPGRDGVHRPRRRDRLPLSVHHRVPRARRLRPHHHGRLPARPARAVRLPALHRRARVGSGEAGDDARRRDRAARRRRARTRRPRPRRGRCARSDQPDEPGKAA